MADAGIAIAGAGLSGLACAWLLQEAGIEAVLYEARARPGGRIRSLYGRQGGQYLADLGPSWVWPAYQPVAAKWLDRLGMTVFAQFDAGQAILDHGPGQTPQMGFLPAHEGSIRIAGGPQALVDALVQRLPSPSFNADHKLQRVSREAGQLALQFTNGARINCSRLIIALPPRIAAEIDWQIDLPAELIAALQETPTWMAQHAKAAIIYEQAFWRDMGLSGRMISQHGPLAEMHDHCGPDGKPAALFGFIGWPHDQRRMRRAELEAEIGRQLQRCFGSHSPGPLMIQIEDWANDPLVAQASDLIGPMAHPQVGPAILRTPHLEDCVFFAGAETSDISPGLIEGALAAAENAVRRLVQAASL